MVTVEDPQVAASAPRSRRVRRRPLSPQERVDLERQDQRLFDLLLRYRAGDDVAELIVAELMPAFRAKVRRMSVQRPLYRAEDMRQELVLELLRIARSLPLPGPAFLSRRLKLASTQPLARRLRREWARQQAQVSLEKLQEEEDSEEEAEE